MFIRLTLLMMDLFGDAHGLGGWYTRGQGWAKTCYKYPTMMILSRVYFNLGISKNDNTQKSRETPLEFG